MNKLFNARFKIIAKQLWIVILISPRKQIKFERRIIELKLSEPYSVPYLFQNILRLFKISYYIVIQSPKVNYFKRRCLPSFLPLFSIFIYLNIYALVFYLPFRNGEGALKLR